MIKTASLSELLKLIVIRKQKIDGTLGQSEIRREDVLSSAKAVFRSNRIANDYHDEAVVDLLRHCRELTESLDEMVELTQSTSSLSLTLGHDHQLPTTLTQSSSALSSDIVIPETFQNSFDERCIFKAETTTSSATNYDQLIEALKDFKRAILKNSEMIPNQRYLKNIFYSQMLALTGERYDKTLLDNLYEKSPCHWLVFILAARSSPKDTNVFNRIIAAKNIYQDYSDLVDEDLIKKPSQSTKQNGCQV